MITAFLRQADHVLANCGRPIPPPGYRWIDFPKVLAYVQVGQAGGTGAAAARVVNTYPVPFLCRGVSVVGTSIPFRISWENSRTLEQYMSIANFAGSGAGMRVLAPDIPLEPGSQILIESNPASGSNNTAFYFWGVLRYTIKADGSHPKQYVPDLSRSPRIVAGPNQNIMAPNWMLGRQSNMDTPHGFYDEPYVLQSGFINNPIGTVQTDIVVQIPADADYFVIQNIQMNTVLGVGVMGGRPIVSIRFPDGNSLTNADMIPFDWQGPVFPPTPQAAGGRIILEVADQDTSGTGSIQTVVQFSGVKRRRIGT